MKVKIAEKYKLFISVIIILNSIFLFKFVLNGPFLLAINPAFYSHTKDFKFLDDMVSKVPKGASVMTQNNLAIRFTHQDIRLITTEYASSMPDYILLDLRPGQNPNSYFGSGDLNLIFGQLKTDKRYELFVKTGNQYLFKRSSL